EDVAICATRSTGRDRPPPASTAFAPLTLARRDQGNAAATSTTDGYSCFGNQLIFDLLVPVFVPAESLTKSAVWHEGTLPIGRPLQGVKEDLAIRPPDSTSVAVVSHLWLAQLVLRRIGPVQATVLTRRATLLWPVLISLTAKGELYTPMGRASSPVP